MRRCPPTPTFAAVAIALCIVGCTAAPDSAHSSTACDASEPIPDVVTADIQAGIERYIAEASRADGGFFTLPYEGKTLRMKLVRVHTEYLANLGPRRHFACVDLASAEGDVYDVDFFLAGDPGAMTVTETTVHKINGKPFYLWEQREDDSWVRQEVDAATPALLGIVEGDDHFEFTYQLTLPTLTGPARLWIPLPSTDQFQSITMRDIDAPHEARILTDARLGNRVLFWELGPSDSGAPVAMRVEVERDEKRAYEEPARAPEQFLEPDRRVPSTENFNAIADKVLADKEGDLVRARALYDHTIDRMRYMKFGEGWGQGDAVRACDAASGNCTDFHAYFIALARAAGIPARFAIGAAVPSDRDQGGVDGYHCWAEFFAEGRWWPVDISEADKYTSLSTYYFGHHPANRVEFSRGRDLVVEPGPVSGPINFLAYPVLEVEGKPVAVKPRFGFRRIPRQPPQQVKSLTESVG